MQADLKELQEECAALHKLTMLVILLTGIGMALIGILMLVMVVLWRFSQ